MQRKLVVEVRTMLARAPLHTSAEEFEAQRQKMLGVYRAYAAELERLPPWPVDPGFRAACVGIADWLIASGEGALVELGRLAHTPEVDDALALRAEAVLRRLQVESAALDARVEEAQLAFVSANGTHLIEGPPQDLPALPPDFVAPGVPPPGSAMPGSFFAGLTVGYHNRFVDGQGRLLAAVQPFLEGVGLPGEACAQARSKALSLLSAEVGALSAIGGWQGDASLSGGTIAFGTVAAGMIDGPGAELCALVARAPLSVADGERANALIGAINGALVQAEGAWRQAQAGFQARWQLAAYEVWQAQRRKAAAR